ncbi:hypothetical protein A6048_05155 [Dietzia psychralcaliphila]|uniref:HTH araC/xylS-type domain-containing protein n=1 Tax=Dietzia psychralcaliphila TaxID=139021 RepID=A0AAD0JSL2_9ACTN|nr:hypothetical protein A6048_05155 [Dietzia psychralcaliphila]PTM86692.1 helix-turn-helix protein [Dietzia psychralcaliphila]
MYSEVTLRDGVALWRSVGGSGSVVPADGCVDLILRDDAVLVAGPSTRWIDTLADGDEGSFGLRLPPGEAASVLGVPLVDLADKRLALEEVVPARDQRITAALRKIAGGLRPAIDLTTSITSATRWTGFVRRSASGLVPARVVAEELAWSERTFRRRMAIEFGYGYATLVRIERAGRARSVLRSGASVSAAAALVGYADQPHLSREFRRLVGMSPGQFVSSSA